ncbi:hypothetical protein OC834_004042 [Tilletia horrida]|nr:hypothetical protein OC834_004042 [Tilletia horrida]
MAQTHNFTLLNAAAGRPLKWPTYLTLCADCVLTEADDRGWVLTLLDNRDKMVDGTITATNEHDLKGGAYLLRHGYIGTSPLRCHVGQDGCLRHVPSGMDGTDPACETLPWAKSLLNGIGVVAEVDVDAKKITIVGKSFLGLDQQWCKYKVRLHATNMENDPLQQFPRLLSLVSFHGSLQRISRDGTFEARLRRISYLQPAFSLLLGELDIIPGQLGKDRAVAALRRLNRDHNKVQRLVHAHEDSVDSEDTPSVAEETADEDGRVVRYEDGPVDRYERKRARFEPTPAQAA